VGPVGKVMELGLRPDFELSKIFVVRESKKVINSLID